MDAEVPGWFVCWWLGITKQALHWWVTSGKLAPVRRDAAGRPFYRFGDALEAERQTRRSGKSRRGATVRRSPAGAAA
jgi:DNA-binding transcriptional MerR regulator